MSLQLFIWLDRKSGRDCFKNAHYRIIAAGYNKLSIRAKSCTLDSVEFVASANWVKVITQFSAAGGIPKFRRTIHSGSNDVFAILIVSRAENYSAALFNCRMRQRSRLTFFHIPNSGCAIIAGRENKLAISAVFDALYCPGVAGQRFIKLLGRGYPNSDGGSAIA